MISKWQTVYVLVIRDDYEDSVGNVYARRDDAIKEAQAIVDGGEMDAHVEEWPVQEAKQDD